MYINSMIGRIPAQAAPSPAPQKPASEIGVLRTRSGPNSSISPLVHPKIPPCSAISSPMMNTFPSRLISSAITSLIACAYDLILIENRLLPLINSSR